MPPRPFPNDQDWPVDESNDIDRVKLGMFTGSGAVGFGLPSFEETQARYAREALRDRGFLRSYFKLPGDLVADPGYLAHVRHGAYERGAALKGRQNWWDDPREVMDLGYRSRLNDRALQSDYLLGRYGFDPYSGQVLNPQDPALLRAAAAHGQALADAQRRAGLLGRQYGDAFALTGEPGKGGSPFGYRQYTDEFGNTILVDGRGNIVR